MQTTKSFMLMLVCALLPATPWAEVTRIEHGNLVSEGIPPIPPALAERLQQYQETRSALLLDWAAEGVLISTRFGSTAQVHLVRQPLGARTQLTFYREPVTSAAWSPDPRRPGFLFARDVGGNEQHQIYFFDMTSGRARLLTDGVSRNGGFVWSRRGDRFAYFSTRRDGINSDIYIGTPDTDVARLVVQANGSWVPLDWSPDDRRLLVQEFVSVTDSRLHLVDVETGAVTRLNPTDHPVGYNTAAFARDGRGIYLVSDEGDEFQRLRYLDLATGRQQVISGHVPWDVVGLALSQDGRWLAYVANEGGIERLHLRDLKRGHETVPPIAPGVITNLRFARDGHTLAFSISTPRSPGDVYVIDPRTGTPVRWTESETGGLDPARFVEPELIAYPTFDEVNGERRRIPAFVYRPRGAAGPLPVVVQIHGGPESQAQPSFSPLLQFIVNELGFAVITPNVRGSSGYGKTYLGLDNGMRREDAVRDIGALLDWIATRPELDAGRVVVYGGSYGGYMTLASLAHYNDRLLGGIDVVGISNFVTFLENTQPYRRELRRVEYGDERIPEMRRFLERISPTANAHRITRPLLVVQGANDPRVPASESEQIVRTVRANGGRVWYLLARDEGHGFRKKENVDYYYASLALFLQSLLKEDAPPAPAGP